MLNKMVMKKIVNTITIILLSAVVQFSYGNNKDKKITITNLVSSELYAISQAQGKILIISTRNFTNPETLELEKGVHPANKRFFFIAGILGDSTIITNYSTLEEAMNYLDNDKNMLVYVNGYNKTFEGTVSGGQKLSERYGVNMLMFDWPTDEKPIRITAKNARKVSNNLAVSLNEIDSLSQIDFPESSLSLVFHSMGNHVARHLVKSGNVEMLENDAIDNIILNAAAVKSYDHNAWVERLKHKKKVYIVMNKQDYVLRGASIFRGVRQLGNVALGENAQNAEYVDFSNLAEKEHSYYLGQTTVEKTNPGLYNFYNTVFHGNQFEKSEQVLLVSNE